MGMSKYERVSTVLSVIAIVVSISSAILGANELLISGKLTVTYGVNPLNDEWTINVRNIGFRRTSSIDVAIVAQKSNIVLPTEESVFTFSDPIQYDLEFSDSVIHIKVMTVLGRNDSFLVQFPVEFPPGTSEYDLDVFVTSESGFHDSEFIIIEFRSGRGF
jgi:hypothetical protein